MTFEEWIVNSIYQRVVLEHADEKSNITWGETVAAMEAAWHAGMKEQYRRDQYAQQQHQRFLQTTGDKH